MAIIYHNDPIWAHLHRQSKVHCTRCGQVPSFPFIAIWRYAKGQRQLIICERCCSPELRCELVEDLARLSAIRNTPPFLRRVT
jgi:hypothetical protein